MSETTPPAQPEGVRERLEAALDASIDRCARCKVCDTQIGAAMTVLGPLLERAEAAEVKLAEVRDACRSIPSPIANRILAITGTEEAAEAKPAAIRDYRVMVDEDGEVVLVGPCAWTVGCLFNPVFTLGVDGGVPLGQLADAALEHEGEQGERAHARLAEIEAEIDARDEPDGTGQPPGTTRPA